MFFSYDLIKIAYEGLIKLDSSTGKSRKEKISGIRYLMATSQLLHQENSHHINLTIGSKFRAEFINAVGDVVSLNDRGLYSKDFAGELDTNKDYGVGSNFLTTRLASSRHRDIRYPGRPASLLALTQERVSILENVGQTLTKSYGIQNIKPELCIWLLRNEDFGQQLNVVSVKQLLYLVTDRLNKKYTHEIVSAILPTEQEIKNCILEFSHSYFIDKKPNYSNIATNPKVVKPKELLNAKVLENDLDDDDRVFKIVQQLLTRGAKGILFYGHREPVKHGMR